MKMIDLTQLIKEDMSLFPGTPPPVLTCPTTIENEGYRETFLKLSSHMGTHVEASAHMLSSGEYLEQVPLEKFFGLALMIDVKQYAGGTIPQSALAAQEADLQNCEFLILNTGWANKWGTDAYLRGYPILSDAAAEYLAGFDQLSGVGVDAVSVDSLCTVRCGVHLPLFAAGKIVVENLANLDAIGSKLFLFCGLPLKLFRSEGSPVRAVAFVAPPGIYYPEE